MMTSAASGSVPGRSPEPTPALDELVQATRKYRNSAGYFELLSFVRRFPRYSPYNALLLHVQNPGVSYTATAAQWKRGFRRTVRDGARPMVILQPFGPVVFVFDVADTDSPPLPDGLVNPFETEGHLPPHVLEHTRSNSALRDRIALRTATLGRQLAGLVRRVPLGAAPVVGDPPGPAKMVVTLNGAHDPQTQYVTLVHELAHIHCGHLGGDEDKWWPSRSGLSEEEREFEAESVAWIVCRRLGLEPHSERYLASYRSTNCEIPDISLDVVMRVAGYIESLGQKELRPRPPKTPRQLGLDLSGPMQRHGARVALGARLVPMRAFSGLQT